MKRFYETVRNRASCGAALLGFLAFETVVVSCASSEDEIGARGDDAGIGPTSDATADASDSACDVDSDGCATSQEPICDDFEWCPVETKHPVGLGLSSVWGSGKDDVWVVGAAGSVTHWDGNDWAPVPVETTWSLYAVWGSGPNDIWTVSAPNKIFHSTGFAGGSAHWSPVTAIWDVPDFRGVVRTIWGTSPSDIWVGGNFRIRPPNSDLFESGWRSVVVDGGAAWAPMSAFAGNELKSIWGSGPEDIWVVGSKGSGSRLSSFAAHTNGVAAADGGIPEWTELDTQSITVLSAVWGSGPGDVWTVGDGGTIRHFTAGSEVWNVVDSPTTESLRGLWGAGPDDIWAVGEHGTILHYDGMAWTISTAAFPSGKRPHLYGVWGSGPGDVWAVGSGIVMHFSDAKSGKRGATP